MTNFCLKTQAMKIAENRFWMPQIAALVIYCLVGCVLTRTQPTAHAQKTELPHRWNIKTGKNVLWSIKTGSQSFSNPTIDNDYILVGANNGRGFDPLLPPKTDLGVMLCFEKKTGKLAWQHSSLKLASGRINDWPLQGVTSQAAVKDGRVWYVSNRAEVVCLDLDGFADGKNDGPFTSEKSDRTIDADLVWKFDMISELNVFPHNISHSNIVVDDKFVYLKTSNGVDSSHTHLPSPDAPSFLVLNRETGEVVWHDNSPGKSIFHGSWGSPILAKFGGRKQILFPGGDGWIYSFVPEGDGNGNSKLLWKFDCNSKTAEFRLGGKGTRNNLLTAPTVVGNRVFVTMGQDPEHGVGKSCVICFDPAMRFGDISPTLVKPGDRHQPPRFANGFRHCVLENGDREIENPNSALIWRYESNDANENGKIDIDEEMSRSLSRVVCYKDFCFVTDLNGVLHCLDQKTGKSHWGMDLLQACWTSPKIIDDFLYVGTEDGEVLIFRASSDKKIAAPNNQPIETITMNAAIYANLAVEGKLLIVPTRDRLWAISIDR